MLNIVITISRKFGSGGRTIGTVIIESLVDAALMGIANI